MIKDELMTPDPSSKEVRSSLAKMIIKLFRLWGIPIADQLILLGLSPKSRSIIYKYERGSALPSSREMLDRVGYFLSIHKSLKLLYPRNKEILYSWIRLRNKAFDDLAPLEVMKNEGMPGIIKVVRYLEFCLVR